MVFWKNKSFLGSILFLGLMAVLWWQAQWAETVLVINDPKSNIAIYEGFSTSAQLNEQELLSLIKTIEKPLTIVDLRQETHGFVNGVAISWYSPRNWANRGKSQSLVVTEEKQKLQKLRDSFFGILYGKKWIPIPFKVRNAYTEEELVAATAADYQRITVTDHLCPSEEQTQTLTKLFIAANSQKPCRWLHFHCYAGRGRSKTAASMYRIFRGESIKDILREDWGEDLSEEKIAFLEEYRRQLTGTTL